MVGYNENISVKKLVWGGQVLAGMVRNDFVNNCVVTSRTIDSLPIRTI